MSSQFGCSIGEALRTRAFALGIAAMAAVAAPQACQAQLAMLHAGGRNIVDAGGRIVPLRGVNLGGWFIMEKWMSPLDRGSLPDTYSVIAQLDRRFGIATEQSLVKTYQQSWITTTDLDDIRDAGFNVVRVPVWWGQFYPVANVNNGGWRADAFEMLNWLVANCATRGLYVIIDMHGVVGGQSVSDDTGQANRNSYWSNGNDQGNTAFMWWQIANHFKGNATVAGYDLINEPVGTPSNQAVVSAYDSLYRTVRSADPDHMVFMEGTWGSWNWSMLPPPTQYGWTNVVYEMHEYQYSNQSASGVIAGANRQVADFNSHAGWNVPGFIGEFNDFGNDAATWQATVNAYNAAGLSWTMWSYKATHGLRPDSWGYYDPTWWPTTPDISSDSSSTIAADWRQWATTNAFARNTALGIDGGGVNGGGGIDTGAWYNVENVDSGKCVDATNWGTANGTPLQQWDCQHQAWNQEWQFQSAGGGLYKVASRNAPAEVWDVTNLGTANGSPTQLWTYGGGTNQQWQAVPAGNGLYHLVGRASGRCLAAAGASHANGAALQIVDCNGGGTQAWKLVAQP
jgi:aryl-phospho-beta-D-glucosidase BglC (GH1 family)